MGGMEWRAREAKRQRFDERRRRGKGGNGETMSTTARAASELTDRLRTCGALRCQTVIQSEVATKGPDLVSSQLDTGHLPRSSDENFNDCRCVFRRMERNNALRM